MNTKVFRFTINCNQLEDNYKSLFEIDLTKRKNYPGNLATVVLELFFDANLFNEEKTNIVVSGTNLTVNRYLAKLRGPNFLKTIANIINFHKYGNIGIID